MPETSTRLLANLAAGGDAASWAALVERHLEGMRRAAAAAAGSGFADDAVQEALLQVRARAGRFRPPPQDDGEHAAGAWLRTIAANAALMLARATRRRRHYEHHEAAMADPRETSPVAALVTGEELSALRRVLGEMPERERRPIVLRYFAGMVEKERLGEALGCSPSAAGVRLHRAMERLRGHLARIGVVSALALLTRLLEAAEANGSMLGAADPDLVQKYRDFPAAPTPPALPASTVIPRPENLFMHVALISAATLILAGAIGIGLVGTEPAVDPTPAPSVEPAPPVGEPAEVRAEDLQVGDRVRARGRLLHFDGTLKEKDYVDQDFVILCTKIGTDQIYLVTPAATTTEQRRTLFKPMSRKDVECIGTWLGKSDGAGHGTGGAPGMMVLRAESWKVMGEADEDTRLHLWRLPPALKGASSPGKEAPGKPANQ
jgi:RNA polymerase sigma-70 factor (ECF subfamily)